MQIFASTTCLGRGRTDFAEVLPALMELGLDGVELGSTHAWRADMAAIIRACPPARVLTHNYFPPAADDLVINLASADAEVRRLSMAHARSCVDFAARISAELYTVHPGFLATAATAAPSRISRTAYDFHFTDTRAPYEDSFALMRDALGALLDHARRAGVRLAIETEGSITRPGMLLMERPDEYRRLFAELGEGLWLNFNLAHSSLAARLHGFDLAAFIAEFRSRFAAVELSHNDGHQDLHRPLCAGSYVFRWLPALPEVPLILEFREASVGDIRRSAAMLRASAALPVRY